MDIDERSLGAKSRAGYSNSINQMEGLLSQPALLFGWGNAMNIRAVASQFGVGFNRGSRRINNLQPKLPRVALGESQTGR